MYDGIIDRGLFFIVMCGKQNMAMSFEIEDLLKLWNFYGEPIDHF